MRSSYLRVMGGVIPRRPQLERRDVNDRHRGPPRRCRPPRARCPPPSGTGAELAWVHETMRVPGRSLQLQRSDSCRPHSPARVHEPDAAAPRCGAIPCLSPSRPTRPSRSASSTITSPSTRTEYFWVTGIDVYRRAPTNVVVAFGDSSTDGIGSTPGGAARDGGARARDDVSLFDVSNMSRPAMLCRVAFGPSSSFPLADVAIRPVCSARDKTPP